MIFATYSQTVQKCIKYIKNGKKKYTYTHPYVWGGVSELFLQLFSKFEITFPPPTQNSIPQLTALFPFHFCECPYNVYLFSCGWCTGILFVLFIPLDLRANNVTGRVL